MIGKSLQLACVCFAVLTVSTGGLAQSSVARDNLALYGNVKIRVTGTTERAGSPQVTLILFKTADLGKPGTVQLARPMGPELSRQNAMNGGTYRFDNLTLGEYELAIEIDRHEVSRTRIILTSLHAPYGLQQNIEFDWQPPGFDLKSSTISAVVHERTAANKRLFEKAENAVAENKTDQAVSILKQIVAADKRDYQAQAILGTLLASQGKLDEAEQAYTAALAENPTFPQALLDFGRLRLKQKRFADAVEPLTKLVESNPDSGEASLMLGDAYVQTNQIAKAIPRLNAAAGLGFPQAHLRLGWIYDQTGAKEKAAAEYAEFLKKKPDYPDRPKLEAYIKLNKKN